jgi:hypothetical protein
MKRHLRILPIIAFAVLAPANEIHRVPVTSRMSSEEGPRQVEAEAQFRDSRATLTFAMDSGGDRIEKISGTLDGVQFHVNVRAFRRARNFQFQNIAMHADCCVNGYAVSWQVPFGAAAQCVVDTPKGKEQQLVHSAIYITIDRGGRVRKADVVGC